MTSKIIFPLLAGVAFGLSACTHAQGQETAAEAIADDPALATAAVVPNEGGTVTDVARDIQNLTTWDDALQAARLQETLAATGPFTIFAPTNDAFGALPDGKLEELTTNDTDTLGAILTYHVVPGKFLASDLVAAMNGAGASGYTMTTVNGATLNANMKGGEVVLTDAAGNSATVTASDVDASNGVIHIIDAVLMPS